MAYSAITSGQTDADSPLDQTLMDLIRTNFADHETRMVTNGDSHDHNGGDGAIIPQGGLKTTTGEVSTSSTTTVNLTLAGGEYGFYPQVKETGDGIRAQIVRDSNHGTTYATLIGFSVVSTGTAFVQQRYFQASPPYKIGPTLWGHFIFALQNISTGDIVSAYQAEDPPWAYNGNPYNAKNSVERIQEVPHPFADYWQKDPAVDGLEVVLLDLRSFNMKKYISDSAKIGKSPLENMEGNIIIPSTKKTIQSLSIPEIIGFTDKVVFR